MSALGPKEVVRLANAALRRLRFDGIKVFVSQGQIFLSGYGRTPVLVCSPLHSLEGMTNWRSNLEIVDPVAQCQIQAAWYVANGAMEILTEAGLDTGLAGVQDLPVLWVYAILAGSRRTASMLAAEPDGKRPYVRVGDARIWPVPYTAFNVARVMSRACGVELPEPEDQVRSEDESLFG